MDRNQQVQELGNASNVGRSLVDFETSLHSRIWIFYRFGAKKKTLWISDKCCASKRVCGLDGLTWSDGDGDCLYI